MPPKLTVLCNMQISIRVPYLDYISGRGWIVDLWNLARLGTKKQGNMETCKLRRSPCEVQLVSLSLCSFLILNSCLMTLGTALSLTVSHMRSRKDSLSPLCRHERPGP
jgi:hypothetical protein